MRATPRSGLAAILAALICAATANGQTQSPAPASATATAAKAQTDLITSANAPLPPREHDYLLLIDSARKQYAASRSIDARRNTRLNLQIAVHDFMGLSHNATDWVGVFKNSSKTREGRLTVEIEIAPGVTITTWDNDAIDAPYGTLLKPYTNLGKIAAGLAIGDTVTFSANLIGSVISTDDDMVLHPQLIAQFRSLEKLEELPPKR